MISFLRIRLVPRCFTFGIANLTRFVLFECSRILFIVNCNYSKYVPMSGNGLLKAVMAKVCDHEENLKY